MKISAILTVLTVAVSASAGHVKQAECKSGYTEFARCKAVSVSSFGPGIDNLGKEMAEFGKAMYNNVLTCSRGNQSYYVQISIPDFDDNDQINGIAEVSPEVPAKISSTGVTHTVKFDLNANSTATMVFGGRAGGKHNALISLSYDRNKTTYVTYEADCSYKR